MSWRWASSRGGVGAARTLRGSAASGRTVDALEGPTAGDDGQLASPEQAFDRPLGLAPSPPAADALRAQLQLRRRQRTPAVDLRQRGVDQITAFMHEPRDAFPHPGAIAGVGHPPAEQRLAGLRQQARLMRPVFEQRRPLPPGSRFQQVAGVGAQAREGRKVVGPRHHIDRVDLHQAQPIERLQQMTAGDLAVRPRGKTLGRQGDPPRLAG